MQDLLFSAIIGALFTCLAFLLCFFTVVGVKSVMISYKKYKRKKRRQLIKPSTPTSEKQVKPYKPVRSIEINPEEIDRIYVKKSS